eukprot:scaffold35780_cov61-Phaeocystis_antarctica.AAC.7
MRVEAVVDYDVRDPHTMMMVRPTGVDKKPFCLGRSVPWVYVINFKRKKKRGDLGHDFCSVCGPLALVNAACEKHSAVGFRQDDLGQCGKLVSLELKLARPEVAAVSTAVCIIFSARRPDPLAMRRPAEQKVHRGCFLRTRRFFTNVPGSPHTSSHMSGHHPATVRRAERKRGARFQSSEALAEQPAVMRSAVELHRCCTR